MDAPRAGERTPDPARAGAFAERDPVTRYRAARRDPALAVLEGFHPLKHALRFGAEVLEVLAVDPAAVAALAEELAPDVASPIRALARPVPAELFDRLLPVAPAVPVIALALRPADPTAEAIRGPAPIIFLEDPVSLWNVGAVIRVAAAAGAAAVLTTGRQDPWNPSALRGAAGLHFALPVARVDAVPSSDRPLVALDPEGEPLRPGTIPPRPVLAFGSERHGLSADLLAVADLRIRIPMRPGVSSLNLATAVAVTLYAVGWAGT